MKKLIATTLVLCMALAAFASLSVTAAYTEIPSPLTHTYQMMDNTSTTGLDAYKGTPTGISDAKWDNIPAYSIERSFDYNSTNTGNETYKVTLKIMWNENGLYLLQTVDNNGVYSDKDGEGVRSGWNDTMTYNPSSYKTDMSSYNIVLPKTISGSDTTEYTSRVIFVAPIFTGDNAGTAYIRHRWLTPSGASPSTGRAEYGYGNDTTKDLQVSCSKTTNGYVMQTYVAWTYFGGEKPTSGQKIGVKFNPAGSGYHINHEMPNISNDRYGHDPVTLCDITPDLANWAITNNTFSAAKTNADGAYLIEDAADLLGLSYVMANSAGTDDTKASALTSGKTFLVTADIDLNPNVDWESFDPATAEVAQEWKTIEKFYGTFDGQGHWIKGVYHVGANDTEFGFIGQLKSGVVKNIRFDNGYMTTTSSKDGGFVVGAVHTGSADVENIYVGENVTVHGIVGSDGNKYAAGIVGTTWSDGTVSIKNAVFAGKVTHAVATATDRMIGIMGKAANKTSGSSAVTITDAIVLSEAGYKVLGNDGGITTANRCNTTPAAGTNDGVWVDTELGVLPVAVADMFATVYWQTTAEESGKFNVRLIGELASLNYTSVDFKVTIVDKDGKTAKWGYGAADKDGNAYALSKTAYNSVLANNEPVGAAALNAGVLDGESNALYTLTLNNLDANNEYKIYATTVWTLADGTTTVESTVEHLVTPVPYVAA